MQETVGLCLAGCPAGREDRAAVGVVAEDHGYFDEVAVCECVVRVVLDQVGVEHRVPHVERCVLRAGVWDVVVLGLEFFGCFGSEAGKCVRVGGRCC